MHQSPHDVPLNLNKFKEWLQAQPCQLQLPGHGPSNEAQSTPKSVFGLSHISKKATPTPSQDNQSYFQEVQRLFIDFGNPGEVNSPRVSNFERMMTEASQASKRNQAPESHSPSKRAKTHRKSSNSTAQARKLIMAYHEYLLKIGEMQKVQKKLVQTQPKMERGPHLPPRQRSLKKSSKKSSLKKIAKAACHTEAKTNSCAKIRPSDAFPIFYQSEHPQGTSSKDFKMRRLASPANSPDPVATLMAHNESKAKSRSPTKTGHSSKIGAAAHFQNLRNSSVTE